MSVLNHDGFRLVKDTGSDVQVHDVEKAQVGWKPAVKYVVEKANAFDPTKIMRRGKYYEDGIECIAMVTPAEADALRTFLDVQDGELLYIVFNYDDGEKHFRVEIDKLPEMSDDGRDFRDGAKLSFVARYTTNPDLPVGYYESLELEEGEGLFELEEGGGLVLEEV